MFPNNSTAQQEPNSSILLTPASPVQGSPAPTDVSATRPPIGDPIPADPATPPISEDGIHIETAASMPVEDFLDRKRQPVSIDLEVIAVKLQHEIERIRIFTENRAWFNPTYVFRSIYKRNMVANTGRDLDHGVCPSQKSSSNAPLPGAYG